MRCVVAHAFSDRHEESTKHQARFILDVDASAQSNPGMAGFGDLIRLL
jgi:hypothetical protein